ncbi:MAG: TolC family protein [Betaproteobacteria bacterium]|nr:TolC family protein [Betaproteobacteria bacterium]
MNPKFLALAATLATVTAIAPAFALDLSLSEAEALLVRQNRELLAARRATEAAGADIVSAGARPNPTVSINSASIDPSRTGPGPLNRKPIDTTFRLDQTIERGNKRELRIGAAQGLERAAQGDSLEVLRQQLLGLRAAYFDLKLAQERVAALSENAQLFARTHAAAQVREKAGDLAPADVAKVRVDYERAQNDVRAAQAELSRTSIAFSYLIGAESEAAQLRASDPWPTERIDTTGVEQAIGQRIDQRPDVRAGQARVEAAERQRDLTKSQRTRDVSIGAQFERFPGNVPTNTVGVGIAFPLLVGNDYSGDIQRAEVQRYAALDALAKVRALAGNEVRRAAADLAAAQDRLARYETSLLEAAQRSANAAEFAFERGATSVLEVLDARRTLRAVKLEALAARAEHAKALAAWRAGLTGVEDLPR